ncbi:MAG: hydrogenase expression/formation protein HypE [Proteobacteria bacterium]|nr:hydrogenase expression/formation protein HypE [Pseudomonadota bacterium]
MDKVLITVGSGGKKSQSFINSEIISRFSNEKLNILADGAHIDNNMVVTTDSFTVFPPFFDGGDIGVLSICGMVNDLASMGAEPKYMTMALVIEEGFPFGDLQRILDSMKKLANEQNIQLVAGDTKVVEKGKLDGIIINVTGFGYRYKNVMLPSRDYKIGDSIILTGPVGEHSIAVLKNRGVVEFDGMVPSDVAPLWEPVKSLIDGDINIKFIRDVTRGGLSAVLNEFVSFSRTKIEIYEDDIPVNEKVLAVCDIYGFDIYSLACEGRLVVVVDAMDSEKALSILSQYEQTKSARAIGQIIDLSNPIVILNTQFGGKIVMDMPTGEILPRIC